MLSEIYLEESSITTPPQKKKTPRPPQKLPMAKGAQRRSSKSQPSSAGWIANETDAPTTTEGISKIDARPHLEGNAGSKNVFPSTALSALAQATIPIWVQTVVMIGLIFGGCCSNVRALLLLFIFKAEKRSWRGREKSGRGIDFDFLAVKGKKFTSAKILLLLFFSPEKRCLRLKLL